MVSAYMFEKIRKLKSEGKNKTEIAQELGLNWKTVDKYLKSNTPPVYKARDKITRSDPFASFLPRVEALLEIIPDLSDREIFEFIWADGYRGSERTVNRRLSEMRAQKPKERFFEQEYVAGEQSQFDFKERVDLPFIDGPRIIYLHVSTLPFSDTFRVRAYPSTNFECFMDGVHSFFEGLGGRTKNIRIDNLSACVARVLKGQERKWTAAFARAIKHYGFGVLPCNPGRGNEKGDVERDIRTFISRLRHQVQMQNIVFKDWDHVNLWLLDFCENLQGKESKERLLEEKKSLEILSQRSDGVLSRTETVSGSLLGTIRIMKSAYSVPDQYIGLTMRAVPGPYFLKVYRGKELIATHPRKPEGENSVLLEHVLSSLLRKPRAMIRWTHRAILFPHPIFEKYYQRLLTLDASSAEREFLKSMNLIYHVALPDIQAGLELVMEHHKDDYFEHLKKLLLTERRPSPENVIALRPLKPNLVQYDFFIPQSKKEKIK